ncbi:hypothetical protein [Cryobacterium sp. PH31-O1]|uniref:hypothetical protein n=1 Tax=Cryobacterium sp. PH31-O1 TaxID=3046306 RepID=UPI0024BB9B8E|nr:hypothetical protein [Cryobacterium sp. PH31-O1]MDJ0338533.1 hypothetical protein [Cryobacterium sp. PH31-O1]
MTAVLRDRCTRLAEPVVALMQRVIESQGNATVMPMVISLIGPVRTVAAEGADGIDNADYVKWAAGAPRTLDAMEQAARSGDTAGVWRAFTDQEAGLNRLGIACAGIAGW